MTTVILSGTAPDSSPLTVSVDLAQHEDEECPAAYGTGIRAWCTLPRCHPGPWHVATTDTAIVKVWPVREEQGTRTGDVMNHQVTYQELFEKYAERDRNRSVIAVVMGTFSVLGVVLAARRLQELKADRVAVRAMTARRAGGRP